MSYLSDEFGLNSAKGFAPAAKAKATAAVLAAVGALVFAPRVFAGGGAVLPSTATPYGYSLSTIAQATAVYNTGTATSNPATPAAPAVPFAVFEGDLTVPAGTTIYVPIYYADNSAPVDPLFPSSVASQTVDAAYLDNQVLAGYGVSAFLLDVDGVTTVLDDSYIVGVSTPTLLDGTPGGNEYITSAAFLSPLSNGQHDVGYGGVINGRDVVFSSSVVTVVPEPASLGITAAAAAVLTARSRRRAKV